jgi:hypothetical protein
MKTMPSKKERGKKEREKRKRKRKKKKERTSVYHHIILPWPRKSRVLPTGRAVSIRYVRVIL